MSCWLLASDNVSQARASPSTDFVRLDLVLFLSNLFNCQLVAIVLAVALPDAPPHQYSPYDKIAFRPLPSMSLSSVGIRQRYDLVSELAYRMLRATAVLLNLPWRLALPVWQHASLRALGVFALWRRPVLLALHHAGFLAFLVRMWTFGCLLVSLLHLDLLCPAGGLSVCRPCCLLTIDEICVRERSRVDVYFFFAHM